MPELEPTQSWRRCHSTVLSLAPTLIFYAQRSKTRSVLLLTIVRRSSKKVLSHFHINLIYFCVNKFTIHPPPSKSPWQTRSAPQNFPQRFLHIHRGEIHTVSFTLINPFSLANPSAIVYIHNSLHFTSHLVSARASFTYRRESFIRCQKLLINLRCQ